MASHDNRHLSASARSRIIERCSIALIISLLISSAPQSAQASNNPAMQSDADNLPLEPDRRIERRLAGNEIHRYRISLASDQFLRVTIEQRGVDVVIVMIGPDAKPRAEIDSPKGTRGSESVSLLADATGEYTVELRANKGTPAGSYEIRIEDLRVSTPADKTRIAAEAAFAQGWKLISQNDPASRKPSIEKFQEALSYWQAADDPNGQANALHGIGRAYWNLGDLKNALDNYAGAVALRREIKDQSAEAYTLNEMGRACSTLSDIERSLIYYEQALTIRKELNEQRGQAVTLNNIGLAHAMMGNTRKALEYYAQALPLWEAEADRFQQANTLHNIGGAYDVLGDWQEALDHYNRALSLWQAERKPEMEAKTLNGLAVVRDKLGEPQKALALYERALAIWQEIKDPNSEATVRSNIGMLYAALGEADSALQHLDQALSIRQKIKRPWEEAYALTNIGYVYDLKGDPQQALKYYNLALPIRKEVNDRRGQAYTLNRIGASNMSLGNLRQAMEAYEQALKLQQDAGDQWGEAAVRRNIGDCYALLKMPQDALKSYQQSLSLWQETKDPLNEAITLQSIAGVERDSGDFLQARKQIENAIAIVESLRARVSNQQMRASYLASVKSYCDFEIDLLMRLHKLHPGEGYDAAALAVSERARARRLLEMLTEARLDIRQGVDAGLLKRERALLQQLDARAQKRWELLKGDHSGEQAKKQIEALAKDIDALYEQHQKIETEIRATSPRYAALTQPRPLSLKEIQQETLDPNTLLLEYSLGDERSYLWAVTQTSITSHELPNRKEIEKRAKNFYGLLTARQQQGVEKAEEYLSRIAKADQRLPVEAARLSELLLGPVASQLESKRLLIVADGALQFVPFQMLPAPAAIESRAQFPISQVGFHNKQAVPLESQPLIIEHEIINLPSASVLALLRREIAGRKPAAQTVAVFADPVFDESDDRVKLAINNSAPPAIEKSPPDDLSQALKDVGLSRDGQSLRRLPNTRREAEAIMSLVPDGKAAQSLGFEANKTTALSANLDQYRIVHFATHGILDDERPALSGVALSLIDKRGQKQNGFLRLQEIYNLSLPAELVVLSACQTGLGKEVKGEGLVGLTRGFMYAGAARVVASLWSVEDRATSSLMKNFYDAMLRQKMSPAAALRAAQIEMSKHRLWKAPYYWAAFSLQGEYR